MVLSNQKERVHTLIKDTLMLLCKNGLSFDSEFSIEALIGITLDKQDCFIVNINEIIKSEQAAIAAQTTNDTHQSDSSGNESDGANTKRPKRKRKLEPKTEAGSSDEDNTEPQETSENWTHNTNEDTPANIPNLKQDEEEEVDNAGDIIIIKEEVNEEAPWTTDVSFNQDTSHTMKNFQDNSMYSSGADSSYAWNQSSEQFPIPGDIIQNMAMSRTITDPIKDAESEESEEPEEAEEPDKWKDADGKWLAIPCGSRPSSGKTKRDTFMRKCDKCDFTTNTEFKIKTHMRKAHEGGYQCSECPSVCYALSSFKKHMDTHSKEEKPLSCSTCGKGFNSKTGLARHKLTHSAHKPFRCAQCDKGFVDKKLYTAHIHKHLGIRDFKCHKCEKLFIRQATLKVHLESCGTIAREFPCQICGAIMKHKHTLTMHMKNMHTDFTYDCVCGKSFNWSSVLHRHERSCSVYLAEKGERK